MHATQPRHDDGDFDELLVVVAAVDEEDRRLIAAALSPYTLITSSVANAIDIPIARNATPFMG